MPPSGLTAQRPASDWKAIQRLSGDQAYHRLAPLMAGTCQPSERWTTPAPGDQPGRQETMESALGFSLGRLDSSRFSAREPAYDADLPQVAVKPLALDHRDVRRVPGLFVESFRVTVRPLLSRHQV